MLAPSLQICFLPLGKPCNFFLIAGHGALGQRNCCKEALGEGEGFYSPMIRSVFLLNYGLCTVKCFSVFPFPVRWDEMA